MDEVFKREPETQKDLESKVKEYKCILAEKAEESRVLRKKVEELELMINKSQFYCDAVQGRLDSVKELESSGSCCSDEELGSDLSQLRERVTSLEGLLKLKEIAEKDLSNSVNELEKKLALKCEKEQMLLLRYAKMDQLVKQKEDVERRLQERYSQVEEHKQQSENSEEEHEEKIKKLTREITERDTVQSKLETANSDLVKHVNDINDSKRLLEAKVDQLNGELEQKVYSEAKLNQQCLQLEKANKDWEILKEHQREQFAKRENMLKCKIKSLRKELQDKDEALLGKRFLVLQQMNQDENHREMAESAQEMVMEKEKHLEELERMVDSEKDSVGTIIKMKTKYEIEINQKDRNIDELTDELDNLNEEMRELQEQLRQQKELERTLQEKNKVLQDLLEDMEKGNSKNGQDKIARMEKLLSMRDETVQELQDRVASQEHLLKEMEETQRRLSHRNQELGTKQRGLSDEVHRWKVKCSNYEQREKEARAEIKQLKEVINKHEFKNTNYEWQLKEKDSEIKELSAMKDKEVASLLAELKRLMLEFESRENALLKERQNLEGQLKKKRKELEASEDNYQKLKRQFESLEEKEYILKQTEAALQLGNKMLDTQLSQKSQLVILLEATITKEQQMSNNMKKEVCIKDMNIKRLQEQEAMLQSRIKDFEEDMEEARIERSQQPEIQLGHQDFQVLRQRVKDLERSLQDNVSSFTESEAALRNRIKELETSEKNFLVKIDDLRTKTQLPILTRSRQERKLQHLREEIRAMAEEKEKSDRAMKEKQHRLQDKIKIKEDEMKKQSEYFEHYKQKLQHKMMLLKEREQCLQSQVFRLEKDMIDLTATVALLRAQLERHTSDAAASRKTLGSIEFDAEMTRMASFHEDGEGRIKAHIHSLQDEMNSLLEREEVSHREKRELRDRLQQAEENEEFLARKLEDFRSRIHELKLSESSLLEEVEELQGENELLKRKLSEVEEDRLSRGEDAQQVKQQPGKQEELDTVDNDAVGECELKEKEIQLKGLGMPQKDSLKSNQLNRLYNTITELMEEQDSQSRYKELRSTLSHLRSQLQTGDIIFREELLQLKWEAILDPSRNKAIQTPSLIQCIKEAVTIARLVPQYGNTNLCACEGLLEPTLIPFLENNSCVFADVMQAVRCGDLEQVNLYLQRPDIQTKLSLLLGSSPEQDSKRLSTFWMNNSTQRVQENENENEDIPPSAQKDTIGIQPQPDLLELVSHKIQNTKSDFISLVTKTLDVDCNNMDNNHIASDSVHGSHSFMMLKSPTPNTESPTLNIESQTNIESLKEIILNLESEVQCLQNEKTDLENSLRSKDGLIQKTSEENAKLEENLRLAEQQVQLFSQELEAVKGESDLKLETTKNNWRQENKVLGRQNEELLNQIAILEANLQSQVVKMHEENIQHQQYLLRLEDEKKQSSFLISKLQENMEEKAKVIVALQECSAEITRVQADNAQHQLNISKLVEEKKQSSPVMSGLQGNPDKSSEVIVGQPKELKESSEEILCLQNESVQHQQNLSLLEGDKKQYSDSISELQEKVEGGTKVIVDLQKELKESSGVIIHLQEEISHYQQTISKMVEEKKQCSYSISEMEESTKVIAELKEACGESVCVQEQSLQNQQKLSKVEDERKQWGLRNAELQEQIKEGSDVIVHLNKSLEEPLGEIIHLQEENNQQQQIISKLVVENKQHFQTISELQKNMDESSEVIVNLKKWLQESSVEITRLQVENVQYQQNISNLMEDKKQCALTISGLQEKMGESSEVIANLQKELNENHKEQKHLLAENAQQLKKLSMLEDEKKQCCYTILGLQKKMEDSYQIVDLKKELKERSGAVMCLQNENAQHLQNISKLVVENKQCINTISALQKKVEESSSLIAELEKALKKSSGEIVCLKEENSEVSLKMNTLIEEKENCVQKLSEQREEMEKSFKVLSELQGEKEHCLQKISELVEANKMIEHEVLKLKEEKEIYSQKLLDLQVENERGKQTVSCLQEQKRDLERQMGVIQRDESISAENRELRERVLVLEDCKKINMDETVRGLKGEADRLMRDNELLLDRIDNLELNQAAEVKINLEQAHREKEILLQKVNILEKKSAEQSNKKVKVDKACQVARSSLLAVNQEEQREYVGAPSHKAEDNAISSNSENALQKKDLISSRNEVDGDVTHTKKWMLMSYKTGNLENTIQEQPGVTEEDIDLKKQLERTETKLRESRGELEKTKAEAQKWYKDLGFAESKREDAVKKLSQAVNEVKRMREASKDSEIMKNENVKQRDKISKLTNRIQELEDLQIDALAHEQHILTLQSQLKDQAALEKSLHDLQDKLVQLKTQLSVQSSVGNDLRAENCALKDKLSHMEEWSSAVKGLKSRYDAMKNQFDELERKKTEAELDVAPLKAKLACIVQKCHDRNSLIIQMVRVLRRHGVIDLSLIEEAEDLVNDTALFEYSKAFSAAHGSQDFYEDVWVNEKMNEKEGFLQSSLSSGRGSLPDLDGSLNYRSCVAKADFTPSPDMPRTVLPTLPLSAGEAVQVTGMPDSHGLYHAEVKGEVGLVPACFLEEGGGLHEVYMPRSKCASPSPRLTSPERIIHLHQQLHQSHRSNYQVASSATSESNSETDRSTLSTPCLVQDGTSLPTGTQVKNELEQPGCAIRSQTRGDVQSPNSDDQVKGQINEPSGRYNNQARRDAGFELDDTWLSRENADCSHSAAARSNLSDFSLLNNTQGKDVKGARSSKVLMKGAIGVKQAPPSPVGSVQIIKTVGQSSLMIGWERPSVDELGCSNGTFIHGYRIYVDGEFHKSVMSSACTKAVLENLDLSVPFQIGVQTLGANGLVAEKVHCHFQSISMSPEGAVSSPEPSNSLGHQCCGRSQQFVAIYSYSPLKDSPNIHPSREVAFKEGDTVWVFGKPRRDGFCDAEANGRRGLAPIAFLEEVNFGLPRKFKEKTRRPSAPTPGFDEIYCVASSSEVPSIKALEHKLHSRKI
ncbi:centromere protein F-like isoform X2 [Acipenser ruthenus]|uniref:centromere protein F-like isoform X2 n=1 Tax=Acipenser ruthenus TaxID=7906 RepID=UPI002741ACFD|nr:centromere protein F-like isoform X2 [Acipenser ruthenus]